MGERSTEAGVGQRDPTALDFPALSRVRLDLLLRELLERVGDVLNAQERLQSLLDGVVSLSADLDLQGVLSRVVAAAARLTDAQYAALAVVGDNHRLAQFVTYGMPAAERDRIAGLLDGRGVLNLLIDEPQPIRLKQIADHPRIASFPANPPLAGPFLGVPIKIRDRVFGYLYLTEKQRVDAFSEEDEEVVVALSSAAAVAIENARLYALTDRRRQWLQATGEISESLLSQTDRRESLRLIVRRALEVSRSDLAAVLLQHDDALVIEVADGFAAAELSGLRLPQLQGVAAEVMKTGRAVLVRDYATDSRAFRPEGQVGEMLREIGQMIFVPFRCGDDTRGALTVGWRHGGDVGSSREDIELVQDFAVHAALALERARSQEDRQLLALLEDRDRIARDLHDQVIQRLFAIGMDLQGASRLAPRPDVQQRILGVVDDLDTTIDEIRGTIFDLRRAPGTIDLRGEIRDIAASSAPALGFTPHVSIRGPARHLVGAHVRPHLLAAIREGLANVARHAGATKVNVVLGVDSTEIELRVEDNGCGVADGVRRSGLANLAARAEQLGGSCEVVSRPAGGTILTWRVPGSRSSTRAADT